MRPNAIEVMRGLQYALTQEIAPQIKTPYEQSQIQTMVMMLEMLIHEWDGAAQNLVNENSALQSLLERSADAVSSVGSRHDSGELLDLARELREAAQPPENGSLLISALTERNYRLKRALTKLLVACEDKIDEPELAGLRAVRSDAYAHLKEWLGKRWSMFAPRGGIRPQQPEDKER